ncbi:hypothetical protein GE09DRAFT_981209 [Coniochaeta sp. 2T2.1]|nr:hypothetical protein GE09DRAFT_981209 [Coniochaeta sp. 2T2.1]
MPTTSPIPSQSNDAPRTPQQSQPPPSQSQPPNPAVDEAATPTRATFAATSGMSAQRPFPSDPFKDLAANITELPSPTVSTPPTRNDSQRSQRSAKRSRRDSRDSIDMDVDTSDDENAGSSGESVDGDGTSKNKKKKTQRFYCTGYPPCKLSFTRSEHLARHIRKHTGERPFTCHCSRKFSRLDNLRQHAQTVHQNEEIPLDSPAAMGTRFQKQVRTDKMRPVGGRARASTAGSTGSTGRGHQKSFSTSSIGLIGSAFPTNDTRRRPPPIVMPADPRARYPDDASSVVHDGYSQGAPSPGGYHTPTSTTSYSTTTNSPGWGPGGRSPAPLHSHSRSHSMYSSYGDRIPGRRLSQPSSSNPFLSPSRQFAPERIAPYSPYSGNSSLLASPTTPTSTWSRRESISSVADDAYRRRTWHPDTGFAGASRLNQVTNTSQLGESPIPPPLADPEHHQHNNQQTQRLPGIESFDIPQASAPMNRGPPSPIPMMIDSGSTAPRPSGPGPVGVTTEREMEPARETRVSFDYDASLNRGINRLDINQPPRDSATAWADEANQAMLARAERVRTNQAPPTARFEPDPVVNNGQRFAPPTMSARHHHSASAPSNPFGELPDRGKRHAWYMGPRAAHNLPTTIPEGTQHVERTTRPRPTMDHPNMNGWMRTFPAARQEPPVVHQQAREQPVEQGRPDSGYQEATYQEVRRPEQPSRDHLRALDALVAVATNEATTAQRQDQERERISGWSQAANPNGGYDAYDSRARWEAEGKRVEHGDAREPAWQANVPRNPELRAGDPVRPYDRRW